MVPLETLVERCRQGDNLAWEALVRRFQSQIYGLAFHYVRNPDDARDLAQDIFVRIYRKLGSAPDGGFVPWMFRVARNLCVDHLRRRDARPPASDLPADEQHDLPASGPGPEESWVSDERKRLVYRALGAMSEQDREIIVLKEIQGLSVKEIADLLGAPIGTVKSRSFRARIALAAQVLALDPSYGT